MNHTSYLLLFLCGVPAIYRMSTIHNSNYRLEPPQKSCCTKKPDSEKRLPSTKYTF